MKIPQEIRDFVSREAVVKVLATVNEDGSPNIGPKGSIHMFDEETLVWREYTGKRHFHNVLRDKRVAIACIDWEKRQGYRFVGEAQVHREGEVYEKVAAGRRTRPQAVVLVRVKEVDNLGFDAPGERIL